MVHDAGAATSQCYGNLGVPFLRCNLLKELISDDLPTLGTPITMMLYSIL